jgi:hypothetical protein
MLFKISAKIKKTVVFNFQGFCENVRAKDLQRHIFAKIFAKDNNHQYDRIFILSETKCSENLLVANILTKHDFI